MRWLKINSSGGTIQVLSSQILGGETRLHIPINPKGEQ